MRYADARRACLALPEVTEEPHHEMSSFRVRGRIFVTVPPDRTHLHVFVPEPLREPALAMHADAVEPLRWGGKVVGLRVALAALPAVELRLYVRAAWAAKAPKTLREAGEAGRGRGGAGPA